MPYEPITNFKDSNNVDLGKKLVTKDYLLEVYGSILENSPASGLIVTPELWTWGRNNEGQLGINNTDNRSTPVTTFAGGNNWKQVSGKFRISHTTAVKTDGTLWTWGTNSSGELGDNTTTQRNTPVTTFAGGTNWKSVACGRSHTAAIKTDGSLWVWGGNGQGQLGTGDGTQRNTPVTTFAGGNNWKQVSCGYNHTAAIKTDGTLWGWGDGGDGRLGDGIASNRNTPVTTSTGGTTWKSVSCGRIHTVAIKTDGTLWGWGYNGNGQLGDNSITNRFVPVVTSAGGTTWKQVSGGGNHTAAIKTDGSLWLWGQSNSGQLGTNDLTPDRRTPVTTFIGGTNWKQVDCGDSHTAAIKTDGSLWIWGGAGAGLGINNAAARSIPVTTFAGGNNWKQVSCGYQYTAAIQTIDYI